MYHCRAFLCKRSTELSCSRSWQQQLENRGLAIQLACQTDRRSFAVGAARAFAASSFSKCTGLIRQAAARRFKLDMTSGSRQSMPKRHKRVSVNSSKCLNARTQQLHVQARRAIFTLPHISKKNHISHVLPHFSAVRGVRSLLTYEYIYIHCILLEVNIDYQIVPQNPACMFQVASYRP